MTIKERLKAGKTAIGTWCLLPSDAVVNVLAKAGLDFVLIDREHGPIDSELAARMTFAAQADGCEPIIRVSENSEADILHALDIGSSGIIVPHVESVSDRRRAISAMKYPPIGKRGYTPYARAGGYRRQADHTASENNRLMSGIILEGRNGIRNVDSISDDENLDLVYFGAYDLSVTLGIPGQVGDPRVMKLMEKTVKIVRKRGKAIGALFHNAEEMRRFASLGIQFLCYKVDANVLFESFHTILEQRPR